MAAPKSDLWGAVLLWSWVALGLVMTLWTHACLALGAFHASVFDGSLFLLQSIYAASGLHPYVDYGFVYPPGPAWLFGQILHLNEIGKVLAAVSLFNFFSVMACVGLLVGQARSNRRFVAGGALLCIGTFIPMACMWASVDPCPLSLSSLTLLLALRMARRGGPPSVWAVLFAVAAVSTLWRWDRALPAILIQLCAAASLGAIACRSGRRARCLRWMSSRLLTVCLVSMSGVFFALLLIAGVGFLTGTLRNEWEFIFRIPIELSPYRRLPIPYPSGEDSQWLFDSLSIVVLFVAAIFRAKTSSKTLSNATIVKACVLISGPVALFPYGLHRADGIHFLPVSALLVTSLLAGWAIWNSVATRQLLIGALCLVLLPDLNLVVAQATTQRLLPAAGVIQADVRELTKECSALIPSDAQSLFVGNQSYRHYLMNLPIFYLANIRLRPATSYISEEPGIQNACGYGSRIGDDLAHTPRPLVLLIDQTPWSNEANLSLDMHDCGKIEAELSRLPIASAGFCSIGSRSIRVELVR